MHGLYKEAGNSQDKTIASFNYFPHDRVQKWMITEAVMTEEILTIWKSFKDLTNSVIENLTEN